MKRSSNSLQLNDPQELRFSHNTFMLSQVRKLCIGSGASERQNDYENS